MWLVAPFAFLVAAIAGHSLLCRVSLRANSVAKFLLSGGLMGVALCFFDLVNWGLSIESAASLATYAALCELYIFLFTLVSGSISVSLLYRLRSRTLTGDEIETVLGGKSMVDRRIANMVAVGLLRRSNKGFAKTQRGTITLWVYRWLQRFFWRAPLIPSVISRPEPEPISAVLPAEALERLSDRASGMVACIALIATAVALFWPHVAGDALFIGDSDRLNHSLSVMRFFSEGYRENVIRTWDDLIFGGFDLTAFLLPSPTSAFYLLWPPERFLYAAGLVSCALLAISACCTYFFIKEISENTFVSFIGAALYQLSAIFVLKVSQSDYSVIVFGLFPLMLLIIRRTGPDNALRCFVGLVITMTYLMLFGFLQKVAYVLIFLGTYTIYRSIRSNSWNGFVVFSLAALVALFASFPRIYAAGEDFLSSARYSEAGSNTPAMHVGARPQTYEVLRLLDDRIFGRFAADTSVHNGAINMHEGVLLYASAFAIFLVAFGILWNAGEWVGNRKLKDPDATFYLLVLLGSLALVLTKVGYSAIYSAFFRMDFIHARLLIIALLPLCVLASLFLYQLLCGPEGTIRRIGFWPFIANFFISAAIVALIERLASRFGGHFFPISWPGTVGPVSIEWAAAVRVALSFFVFMSLIGIWLLGRRIVKIRTWVAYCVGFLMFGQAFSYAKDQISGEHMRTSGMPFAKHVRLLANAADFSGPSEPAKSALRERLEVDHFRTSLICDPTRIAIYCSPHVAHFWGLRMIDGYLNAVPVRVAALPFSKPALGSRVLSFEHIDQLPWPLLGMLNVKYAIAVTRGLFTNSQPAAPSEAREFRPDDAQITENPVKPTPRVFFARSVQTVADLSADAKALFPGGKPPTSRVNLEEQSYAERLSEDRSFIASGEIRARFSNQDIQIEVEPFHAERFLVVNERYHPRWRAYVDGQERPVYATNVFMRGVIVPAQATRVTMQYVPFIYSGSALACYTAAIITFLIGMWVFAKKLSIAGKKR